MIKAVDRPIVKNKTAASWKTKNNDNNKKDASNRGRLRFCQHKNSTLVINNIVIIIDIFFSFGLVIWRVVSKKIFFCGDVERSCERISLPKA